MVYLISKNNLKGGRATSRDRSENQNKKKQFLEFGEKTKLTYVKYSDHVLFRNCDSSKLKPCIRETVGWLTFEDKNALYICSDIPTKPIFNMKKQESGLIILKSAVLERIDGNLTRILSTNQEHSLGKCPKNGENKNAKADHC